MNKGESGGQIFGGAWSKLGKHCAATSARWHPTIVDERQVGGLWKIYEISVGKGGQVNKTCDGLGGYLRSLGRREFSRITGKGPEGGGVGGSWVTWGYTKPGSSQAWADR